MFLDPDEVMEAANGHCEYKETTCISLYTLLQQPYSLITEDNQLGFFILLLRRLLRIIKVLVALCHSF
jgi:hypothetical protein